MASPLRTGRRKCSSWASSQRKGVGPLGAGRAAGARRVQSTMPSSRGEPLATPQAKGWLCRRVLAQALWGRQPVAAAAPAQTKRRRKSRRWLSESVGQGSPLGV